jgi:hypothetical protein
MRANVGDRMVIRAHTATTHERDGEIIEVWGPEGGPPYVVRWSDTGHEVLFYPGSDAAVDHYDGEGSCSSSTS